MLFFRGSSTPKKWEYNYYKDSHFKRYDCEIKICLYVACVDLDSVYFKRIGEMSWKFNFHDISQHHKENWD